MRVSNMKKSEYYDISAANNIPADLKGSRKNYFFHCPDDFCGNPEHNFIVSHDIDIWDNDTKNKDDHIIEVMELLSIHTSMENNLSFWGRLKVGIKYILGMENNCMYLDTYIGLDDAKHLSEVLDKYINSPYHK